jgi:hypothetical protein
METLHDCGEHDKGFVASPPRPTVEELLAMEATVPSRWRGWVVYRGVLEQGPFQFLPYERRGEFEESFQQTDGSAISQPREAVRFGDESNADFEPGRRRLLELDVSVDEQDTHLAGFHPHGTQVAVGNAGASWLFFWKQF